MDNKSATLQLNSISIKDVGLLLGIKLPEKGSARCPFPDHRDSDPSFSISRTRNYWVCYGCDRRGGSIDLVKEMLGISFIDAKRWLKERSDLRDRSASPRIPRFTAARKPLSSTPSKPDNEVLSALMDISPIGTTGVTYLNKRAISLETIRLAAIGQVQHSRNRLNILIEQFGFERIYGSGLLSKSSTKDNFTPIFPNDYLLFPFFDNGFLQYIQARSIDDSVKSSRWRNLNFHRRIIYKIEKSPVNTEIKNAICEGVIDALSAVELGYRAIALMGVSADIPLELLLDLRFTNVDVLLDWDVAGEQRATEVMDMLSRLGISAIRKKRPFPQVKDLNEYLVQKAAKK